MINNNYLIDKKYFIKTLQHFWYSREDKDVITTVKDEYVIFKKSTIEPLLLSKINYCRRALIKIKTLDDIFKKYIKTNFVPYDIITVIKSFLGINDKLYFKDDEVSKFINNNGFCLEYDELRINKKKCKCNKCE